MRRTTIKDIARLAGVSYTTVSRALNNAPDINPKTKKQILELCTRECYRANLLARSLSARRANLIGMIVPDIDNANFSEIYLNTEIQAQERGCHVILCSGVPGDGRIRSVFDFMIGHRVDGIILISSDNDAQQMVCEASARTPTILLGECVSDAAGMPINLVSPDNALGGRMAAEYLFRLGHREVLYLGHRPASFTHAQRYRGFTAAAEELGMHYRTLTNTGPRSTIEAGYRLAKELFFRDFPETAIFAASDALALGVMQAADEFGIAIPERISLLGFDNIGYAALPKIRLTTLDQRKAEQARAAVELLYELIERPEEDGHTHRLLPPILVERDSCRRL